MEAADGEMRVEGGGDRPDQRPGVRLDRNAPAFLFNESVGDQRSQRGAADHVGRIGSECSANGVEVDAMIAHQPLDDRAAQPVVAREAIAARDRQTAFFDEPLIFGDSNLVLNETLRHPPD